jgi:hypothetical protein
MILPRFSPQFTPAPLLAILVEWQRLIEKADAENIKRVADIELATARVILTSPNGTRYALQVANDGTLSTSAV